MCRVGADAGDPEEALSRSTLASNDPSMCSRTSWMESVVVGTSLLRWVRSVRMSHHSKQARPLGRGAPRRSIPQGMMIESNRIPASRIRKTEHSQRSTSLIRSASCQASERRGMHRGSNPSIAA